MKKVVLSKKASNKFNRLLEYLETEWTLKVKKDFVQKLDKSLIQIQKFPNSCPQTDFVKGLHMLVVTKQTSIFYRFDSKTITIITIFDNRMNPDKLEEEIKQ